MSTSKEDALVQCPYYKEDGPQLVRCEGVQAGCCLHLGFSSKRNLRDYKNHFCRDSWTTCLIAKMLNQKYDYEP